MDLSGKLFHLRHKIQIFIHFTDSRGCHARGHFGIWGLVSFPRIPWDAAFARDQTTNRPIGDNPLYLLSHSRENVFFYNHFFLKNWHHTWNDPRIKSKTSRNSVFTCSGMKANTMKLIPNRGIKSSVDFASLLKQQSKNRFKMSPLVKQIFSIHVCTNNEMWLRVHFKFQLRGPEMEKKTSLKLSAGK